MRSYLMSILIVGIALGAVGLGTYAYFTDTETIANNQITTGNADLVVWTAPGSSLTATGVVPSVDGWTEMGFVGIKNDGTIPLDWVFYASNLQGAAGLDMSKFTFRLTTNPTDYTGTAYEEDDKWGIDGAQVIYQWSEINSRATSKLTAPAMPVGAWQVFKIEVNLDETAGNTYQDKTLTLDVKADAFQPEDPAGPSL